MSVVVGTFVTCDEEGCRAAFGIGGTARTAGMVRMARAGASRNDEWGHVDGKDYCPDHAPRDEAGEVLYDERTA